MATYRVSFWIEWGPPAWLWAADEQQTRARFDYGPINDHEDLPISASIRERGNALSEWFQDSLNWSYPPDPGSWRQEECDRFKQAARAFFHDLQHDLGEDYEVIYSQDEPDEDPELDEYLRDPKNFRRKSTSP